MKDRRIRMVALDLDGTTLNSRKEISRRTVQAFHSAMNLGVHIVVATGRTLSSLPNQLLHIDGLEYVITSNGSHITELAAMKTIYEDHIPPEAVEQIAGLIRGAGISVETFVDGKAYIDRREYDDVLTNGSDFRDVEYIRETRNPVPDILDFMLANREFIENINLNFRYIEDKERWRPVLEQIPDTTLTTSFIHNFEIGGRSTSKAEALRFLMKKLDVNKEELMAAGDSLNDSAMLQLAGIGVAMANAEPEIREMADYVTDSNDGDGVAKAIERFVL